MELKPTRLSREKLQKGLASYESKHTTAGCKVTHMFGIPLVALAIPVFIFGSRRTGLTMFGLGALLQLAGHYVFEKNKPVFLSNPGDLMNYTCALMFAGKEWLSVARRMKDHTKRSAPTSKDAG